MFITFEGPEGSGKTTNAAWLAGLIEAGGRRVLQVREPGGTALGERVRSLLLDGTAGITPRAELLLFEAARAELVGRVIRPALADGAVVICDRFADSTLAYQGHGAGLPLDEVSIANRLATGGLRPDLTVLLDLDPELGLRRREGSGEWNSIDARSLAFHQRVRAGFQTLAADDPDRWLVLDAGQPLAAIRSSIAARLGLDPAPPHAQQDHSPRTVGEARP